MAGRDYSWFQIHSYSSLSRIGWNTAYHEIPGRLRRNFVLSGPSTFYRDALHWLMEPSGVVAYRLFAKTFSYDLINVPGDKNYLDENGFCNCVKKMGDGGLYSSGHCSCRYLGENRDKLVYVRVTADRQFSLWTLVDYNRGVWCLTRVVAVDNLPESLFFGRVLAFDRVDSQLLFIRVKKKIYSYHYLSGELKELCQILKKYGGEVNCLGFVIPYELPRICFTIPETLPADPEAFHHILDVISQSHLDRLGNEAALFGAISIVYCQLRRDSSALTEEMATRLRNNFMEDLKGFQSRLSDDGHLHMYQQGISQVVAKYFPHLQPTAVNTAGLPLWSCYDFCFPFTIDGLRDTINYNNFVRIEASLYGCTAECEPLAGPTQPDHQ